MILNKVVTLNWLNRNMLGLVHKKNPGGGTLRKNLGLCVVCREKDLGAGNGDGQIQLGFLGLI